MVPGAAKGNVQATRDVYCAPGATALSIARRDAALFGSRRPKVGAGLRQSACTQLADGLDDRPRDVAHFLLKTDVAVERFVTRRVGLVVAEHAVDAGTGAGVD